MIATQQLSVFRKKRPKPTENAALGLTEGILTENFGDEHKRKNMSTTISFAPIIFRIHHRPWHPPRTPARRLGHQRLRFTSGISSSFKDKRTLKLTSMAESARIRDGNGDGGIRALEQEGLIDGSSNLGADGFEATLNSLVS